jgi:hypothetical protein
MGEGMDGAVCGENLKCDGWYLSGGIWWVGGYYRAKYKSYSLLGAWCIKKVCTFNEDSSGYDDDIFKNVL